MNGGFSEILSYGDDNCWYRFFIVSVIDWRHDWLPAAALVVISCVLVVLAAHYFAHKAGAPKKTLYDNQLNSQLRFYNRFYGACKTNVAVHAFEYLSDDMKLQPVYHTYTASAPTNVSSTLSF